MDFEKDENGPGTLRCVIFVIIGILAGYDTGGILGGMLGFCAGWVLWCVVEILIFGIRDAVRGFPALKRK